jgi:anaerobic C4-dicarboxylate transporter
VTPALATNPPPRFRAEYLLNHSFMVPGLIGVGVSTTVAYGLSRLAF